MSQIVFLVGDVEYSSHVHLRPIAEMLQERDDTVVEYRIVDPIADEPDFPESTFGDLAVLENADLVILATRFRVLSDDETSRIERYIARGGHLVATRTANHAFHPVSGSPWFEWTRDFGRDVIGSPWIRHHGHSSTTDVHVTSEHPITSGIPRRFSAESWLYVTDPPADATVLLDGDPVDPEGESVPSPVAWARDSGGQRIFYTSLGSAEDFAMDAVRRLLLNAVDWCLTGEVTS